MNYGGGGVNGGGRKKIFGPPSTGQKDIDEELILFQEMHKKEKNGVISLLQPVSDEFEANGNYPLYKMASARKGSGYEFLAESGKNDYDWLKTPPATPLFPSLEMEAKAVELVVQREIPVIQPLSRFSGNSVTAKASSTGRCRSPNRKSKAPLRSVTAGERPTISAPEIKTTKCDQKMNYQSRSDLHVINKRSSAASISAKPRNYQQLKESHDQHFLGSNLSKSIMGSIDSKMEPKSGGVSPLLRSTTNPAQIPGISTETPPNLRTVSHHRPSSALRGRSTNLTVTNIRQKIDTESNPKTRRQLSCSPNVTRGRKVETKQERAAHDALKGGKFRSGNGTQILGSRMVDKVMHARKSSVEERETKPNPNPNLRGSINQSSGFGMMKSKSSLDVALKHMDIKRDSASFHRGGTTARRN